jgi:hypothetical protein
MSFIRIRLLTLITTGLFLIPLPTSGDVGPVRMFKGGGVVAPQSQHESIRLDSQKVIIRLKGSSYVVDAVFNLFNTGETTTEWTGFPKCVAPRDASYPIRFEGWVNGKQVEFSDARDLSRSTKPPWNLSNEEKPSVASRPIMEEHQWLVSQIEFAGRAVTTIRVIYEAPYYGKDFAQAYYIYGTGCLWKDNIGEAVFIVDSTEVGGTDKISTSFENRFRSMPTPVARPIMTNVLRYEIRDFKPYPEAHFKIKRSVKLARIKANYVRMKGVIPMPPPPPLPTKKPVNN